MASRNCHKEVIPFTAMVAMECINVGVNVLFKAATQKGLSYYVFIAYSYLVATLVLLLPLPFFFKWSRELPPLKVSLILRIFPLGIMGVLGQLCAYRGIAYATPTIASSLSNLSPCFTFILAIIFRMEKVNLRSKSSQAKIMGSTISILGALIVVLYKGPIIIPSSSTQSPPNINSSILSSTSQSNWVLGGFLLFIGYLNVSIWYILLTKIIKEYPSEVIVVFFCNLCGALVSVPVCLLLEPNLSAWKLNPDISMISIIYSGFFCSGLICLVRSWGLRIKGPVYISLFRPFSIVIAASFSAIFLGDALFFGTVVGAIIISFGFYGVIWGKAREELNEDFDIGSVPPSSNIKTPLLQDSNVVDTGTITHNNC